MKKITSEMVAEAFFWLCFALLILAVFAIGFYTGKTIGIRETEARLELPALEFDAFEDFPESRPHVMTLDRAEAEEIARQREVKRGR